MGDAFDALVIPLLDPGSLLGMAAFGIGAAALGWVLASRHVAMAACGCLVWAAGMTAALRLAGDGGLQWAPVVIAASALVALAIEHRARIPRTPFPQARSAAQAAPSPAATAP